jgi:large subunit ribosomal protein L6
MSRIGKLPVAIPSGVTITINGQDVSVKGSKGELRHTFNKLVKVSQADNTLTVQPNDESDNTARGMWGLSRTLLANMIEGVTKGYEKELTIKGVGYKVATKGNDLELALGFSHPVPYKAPAGITFEVDAKKNTIKVSGIDKQRVGQTAAEIRSFRPPEPYKGKGIAYTGEQIRRKAGKTAGK